MIAALIGVFVFVVVFATPVMAGDETGIMEVKLSMMPDPLAEDVESGLDYLFEILADEGAVFDAARIQGMLDFVVGMKDEDRKSVV